MHATIVLELEIVTRRLAAPAVYRFPELGEHDGKKFYNWGWYSMDELDDAVTAILQKQGYRNNQIHYIPQYQTFNADHYPRRMVKPFAWIIHLPRRAKSKTSLHVSPDMQRCDFRMEGLYVPTGWGVIVLRLANEGIIEFRKQPTGIVTAVKWDKSWIDNQEEIDKILIG